jgi:adenosine deaminase
MHMKNYAATFLLGLAVLTTRAQSPAEIAHWPKIELHLHLDCSLSYELVHRLDPTITPEVYQKDFIAPPHCPNLAEYIARAVRETTLMQTKEQLRLATLDVIRQLQTDQVIYAEIRFAPLLHLKKNLTPEQVVAAVDDAVTEGTRGTGLQIGILLCTLRHFTRGQSMQTVQLVEKFKGTHVVGFDIAGDEAGFPLENHVAAFQYAQAHHIFCTAHAGEASGPNSVRETLTKLRPSRIGHGVRSSEDAGLKRYIKDHNILLEICPTSNIQTNMYTSFDHHPVDNLYRDSIPLSINTDCRTISNTTLDNEYAQLVTQFHWTARDFLRCNLEAVDHAFTSDAVKSRLRQRLLSGYR